MTFHSPYALLLFAFLPILWWFRRQKIHKPAIRFSTIAHAKTPERSLKQRLGFLPSAFRTIAISFLIIALARPQKGVEQIREINEGIAIEMVIDRSSSMGAEMTFGGQNLNRLEIVKNVFKQFVLGDKAAKLEGRPNDLIGMISFARYAETKSPLTLAHGALPKFLETVQLAQPRSEEDGTAIGDAIALASARLEKAEEVMRRQSEELDDPYELKSKVMILLTDGEQTAGIRDPIEAAKLAKEWGIKIYTIAVAGGNNVQSQSNLFGAFISSALGTNRADTRTLKAIAKETGGRFFEARNAKSLANIYQEIDTLERSEIQSLSFTDYKELFVPFAYLALVFLTLECFLNSTIFRKVP